MLVHLFETHYRATKDLQKSKRLADRPAAEIVPIEKLSCRFGPLKAVRIWSSARMLEGSHGRVED